MFNLILYHSGMGMSTMMHLYESYYSKFGETYKHTVYASYSLAYG